MVVKPTQQLGPHLAGAVQTTPGGLVLHLWGEVDMSAEPALGAWLAATLASREPVVVDLSAVPFIDLRGVRTLTTVAAASGADMALRGGPVVLGLVLDAVGDVSDRITVEPSRHEELR